MDPYLERPGLWPDFHNTFIVAARQHLAPRLRPKFFVGIEERVYISDERDPGRHAVIPDIAVIELPEHEVLYVPVEGGGTVEVAEPIVMKTLMDHEIRESRLEVLDAESRTVVTVIEVASPANKIQGARGYSSYSDKRAEIMNSPASLVEIDLLRAGVSFVPAQAWNLGDYFVHVSRAGVNRPDGKVWPIRLHHRLPVIDIPLRPGDKDVQLDLQAVFNSSFDQAGYDLVLDYHGEPEPPLSSEQQMWADKLLRDKGLR
jgi:hypothetical protein